jgi:hypothetical protein
MNRDWRCVIDDDDREPSEGVNQSLQSPEMSGLRGICGNDHGNEGGVEMAFHQGV